MAWQRQPGATPALAWRVAAIAGLLMTAAAVTVYLVADARDVLFDTRTLQFQVELLLFAAGVTIVLSSLAGIRDIRSWRHAVS